MTVSEHLYHQCLQSFEKMHKEDQSLIIFTMIDFLENHYDSSIVNHLCDEMKGNLVLIDAEIGVSND